MINRLYKKKKKKPSRNFFKNFCISPESKTQVGLIMIVNYSFAVIILLLKVLNFYHQFIKV